MERIRAEIDSGTLWKARDRLQGLVRVRPGDQEVLSLLGEVHFRMGDLPSAGRCWFLTERTGPEVDQALAAMEARHTRGALDVGRQRIGPPSVR